MKNISDNILVRGCLRGERKCKQALFYRYSELLYATCLRYLKNKEDAEDTLHDAFIRAFRYMESFNIESGSFKNWIFTITVNECLKRIKRSTSFLDIDKLPSYGYENTIEIKLEAEELIRRISQLPHPYSTVINLYLVEGYSHREIGEMLHVKENSSRSILSRAKKMLIEEYEAIKENNI